MKVFFSLMRFLNLREQFLLKGIPIEGKGIMSGRYPIKAVQNMINILKALKGNVIVNGMDLKKLEYILLLLVGVQDLLEEEIGNLKELT